MFIYKKVVERSNKSDVIVVVDKKEKKEIRITFPAKEGRVLEEKAHKEGFLRVGDFLKVFIRKQIIYHAEEAVA